MFFVVANGLPDASCHRRVGIGLQAPPPPFHTLSSLRWITLPPWGADPSALIHLRDHRDPSLRSAHGRHLVTRGVSLGAHTPARAASSPYALPLLEVLSGASAPVPSHAAVAALRRRAYMLPILGLAAVRQLASVGTRPPAHTGTTQIRVFYEL